MSLLLTLSINLNAATVLQKEELPAAIIEKIEFDGHTYIHYKTTVYNLYDKFMHDPSCECKQIENVGRE